MALMAELPNGTIIGIRGCRSYSMAGCNSSDVCNGKNETMPQGAHFKRCIGECCRTSVCNLGFYPVFPVVSLEPASSYASAMATGSLNLTSGTNNNKPGPTSRAAAIEFCFHFSMGLFYPGAILSREIKVALFYLSSLAPKVFTGRSRVVKQSFF